nr:alpha/beta hydrolase [Oceanococcus sp. HetDA_MAG_MS8]
MTSVRTRLVEQGLRLLVRSEPASAEEAAVRFRRALQRLVVPTIPVFGVRRSAVQMGGLDCLVLAPRSPVNTLLYLHGGGFVAGRPQTYINMAARLARRLNARVVLPDYRKAPEHPFPAGPDDVLAVYRQLLEEGQDPQRLLVGGDSAGGGLALSVLIGARDAGLPQPAGCMVLSPATDQSWSGGTHVSNADSDPVLSPQMIQRLQDCYVPDLTQRTDPRASPALADWDGCAPLIVVVSRSECLYDDSLRLVAKAREAGVNVTLHEEGDRMHVWPIMAPLLPESVTTLKWLGDAMAQLLPAPSR